MRSLRDIENLYQHATEVSFGRNWMAEPRTRGDSGSSRALSRPLG
jgi:hypothetical protein